jgi:hypothetical protein
MNSPHKIICWKGQGPTGVSTSELSQRLQNGETCEGVELLPVDEVSTEVTRLFPSAEKHDDVLSWSDHGALHRIRLNPYYLLYDYEIHPDFYNKPVDFLSRELTRIAGHARCVIYFPTSGTCMEHPVGSVVRAQMPLHFSTKSQPPVEGAMQLPITIFDAPDRPTMTEFVAVLDLTVEQLEAQTSIRFEDDIDNLCDYKLALVQVGDYRFFVDSHPLYSPEVAVQISKNVINQTDAVDSLMTAFHLTSADLQWTSDTVKFVEHELWRQDDNGNSILIERMPCRADALAKVRMYTERGHKQLYWAQPVQTT